MFIANNTMPISQDHCKWQKEKDPIEKQQFCVTSADLQVICKSMKINSLGFRTVWLYSGHDDESWASSHEQRGEDISEKTKGQSLTCQEREQEKRGERERERERNQIYIFVFNLLYTLRWSHGTTLWKASCTAGKINKKWQRLHVKKRNLRDIKDNIYDTLLCFPVWQKGVICFWKRRCQHIIQNAVSFPSQCSAWHW